MVTRLARLGVAVALAAVALGCLAIQFVAYEFALETELPLNFSLPDSAGSPRYSLVLADAERDFQCPGYKRYSLRDLTARERDTVATGTNYVLAGVTCAGGCKLRLVIGTWDEKSTNRWAGAMAQLLIPGPGLEVEPAPTLRTPLGSSTKSLQQWCAGATLSGRVEPGPAAASAGN